MSIEALFFDFDGVLWDSETAAWQSWRETYAEFGQEMSLDAFAMMLGTVGGIDPIAELEQLVGHPIERGPVAEQRWNRKMELVGRLRPRPGVLAYLADARQLGVAVAIVSTDDTPWISTGLNILGLSDAWDFIECAEGDVENAKPSPTLYLRALDRLQLNADEGVAIEDSPNGIRAAKRAGLFCLAFANEVTRQLDLSEADLRVDSLEELPLAELLRHVVPSSQPQTDSPLTPAPDAS